MLQLFKYVKKEIPVVFIIILLLIVQAICDLSLPDYTGTIVNVGIQQEGIENAVPTVIREQSYNTLEMFMNKNDKQIVEQNYTLIDKNNLSQTDYDKFVKEYPALKNEPLYKLNDHISQETKDQLNGIFGRSYIAVSVLSSDSDQITAVKNQILATLPSDKQQSFAQMSAFDIVKNLPESAKLQITQKIQDEVNQMPDSIITQAATKSVKQEYIDIGIDVNKLQIWYLLSSGFQMLLVSLASVAASITTVLLASRVAAFMGRELRNRIFSQVMDFSGHEMSRFSTASLITRSTNDIQQVQLLMVMLLRLVFYAPIIAIGGVLKLRQIESELLWVLALAVGVIMAVVAILFVFVLPRFKKIQSLIDKINLIMREILTGLPVIRAFSSQRHENQRFDRGNQNLTKTQIFVNRVMGCMMPIMMFIMNGVSILIVWEGGKNVDSGNMQVGDMMVVIQYSIQILMAFLMICMISVMLPRAQVAAKRIEEVLKTPISVRDPAIPVKFSSSKKGLVTFNNVSFKYPNAGEYVLSDISFETCPGQTTAVIGSTGSGKTTLVSLIPRFYDVSEGEILVDGVNVKEVSLRELRSKIGYVPQKGFLFSGDIKSNIAYGKDISEQSLIQSAKIAQAYDFIDSKPQKFEYEISQEGTNVSGGQRQRLSIARAIAIDPEIYIFDDSFSALDYKTDNILRKELKKVTQNAAVLIVAQRISTILHADNIIVLDDGKMVGYGTHKELMSSCGVYREIAQSQLSGEELNNA